MSVHVEITIADGSARRHLEINRITGIGGVLAHQNPTFEYEVILDGGSRIENAIFEHTYRDDVLTLITEAIAALRLEGVTQA